MLTKKSFHSPLVGAPVITALEYNQTSFILTCTSSGGPVDSVIWTKNISDPDQYSTHQEIVNFTEGRYDHTLTIHNREPTHIIGTYNCTVSNSNGSDTETISLYGKLYVVSQFAAKFIEVLFRSASFTEQI